MKKGVAVAGLALVLSGIFLIFAGANNIVTFGVDLVASDSYLSIEVDENIDFGSLNKGEESDEITVHVNNTGNADIIITPILPDSYPGKIFKNLYFREQKSSVNDPDKNTSKRIGDFSMKIAKPVSGNRARKEQFYAKLNLRNYNNSIYANMRDEVNVTIIAVPQ